MEIYSLFLMYLITQMYKIKCIITIQFENWNSVSLQRSFRLLFFFLCFQLMENPDFSFSENLTGKDHKLWQNLIMRDTRYDSYSLQTSTPMNRLHQFMGSLVERKRKQPKKRNQFWLRSKAHQSVGWRFRRCGVEKSQDLPAMRMEVEASWFGEAFLDNCTVWSRGRCPGVLRATTFCQNTGEAGLQRFMVLKRPNRKGAETYGEVNQNPCWPDPEPQHIKL